jgi:uncharacterized protein YunC (DUF1805 family)
METIELGQKTFKAARIPTEKSVILLIQGGKGFLGCGYFKVEAADTLGEAVAIVSGVSNYEEMCQARIIKVSAKARDLGISEGMSGEEALQRLA